VGRPSVENRGAADAPTRASRGRSTTTGASPAECDLGQALLSEAEEGALPGGQIPLTAAACEIAVQDQGLPSQDLGKELGGVRSVPLRVRFFRGCRGVGGGDARIFGRLVSREFGFDVRVGFRGALRAAGVSATAPRTSNRSARTRCGLIANAFANTLRFFEKIVEEPANVVRHVLDHDEDLFEDVSNEIRGRHPKIVGKVPNLLGELFRDARMEDAFFPPMLRTATRAV